jgi:hypothetical protein
MWRKVAKHSEGCDMDDYARTPDSFLVCPLLTCTPKIVSNFRIWMIICRGV